MCTKRILTISEKKNVIHEIKEIVQRNDTGEEAITGKRALVEQRPSEGVSGTCAVRSMR